MSCYIVSNKTLTVLAKGFLDYHVSIGSIEKDVITSYQNEINKIGQYLLNENAKSVNYRYGEDEHYKFKIEEPEEYNDGILYGCIGCYNYQACEVEDYYFSEVYQALQSLKVAMLERFLKKAGFDDFPWGV